MITFLRLLVVSLMVVTPLLASGQQAPAVPVNASPDAPIHVGRIDVGVNASIPAGTFVVTNESIRNLDRKDLGQAVELLSGVALRRLGPRNETELFLRGFDLRQVPILIDGFPVYVPYDGHFDLGRFLTAGVGEIRVSKGVTSVLYGPNALGGAINVISAQPTRTFQGLLGVSAGSGSEALGEINVGSLRNRWWGSTSMSWRQSTSFPLAADFAATPSQPAGNRLNASNRDTQIRARAGYTSARGWQAAAGYSVMRDRKDGPPYAGADPAVRVRYWQWPRWDKDGVWAMTNVTLGSSGYARARAWRDTFDNALYSYDNSTYTSQRLASSFKSIYDDHTTGGSVEWGQAWPAGLTTRGALQARQDVHREFNEGEPVRQFEDRIYSGGGEVTWTASKLVALLAVGGDHLDTRQAQDFQQGVVLPFPLADTGGFNPQASLAFQVSSDARLHALVSRKTRLPAMKDRFSYRMGQGLPNPELRAEYGTTVEAGYSGSLGRRLTVSGTAFRTRVDNLVQRFFIRPNLFQFRNIGEVSHSGVELTAAWRPTTKVKAEGLYNFLKRRNRSDPAVPLFDTPTHRAVLTGTWVPTARVQLATGISHESSRPSRNETGRNVTLAPWTRVDVKGSVRVGRGLSLDASMGNVTDRLITLAEGFPDAGRTWRSGLRWEF